MEDLELHPLERVWKMYVHYPLYVTATESYGNAAYHSVYKFNTVEDFWKCYVSFPQPSSVFGSDCHPRIKLGGRIVEAFGIFEDGKEPEWEKNPKGGHIELGGITNATTLDKLWEIMCLMLVGETSHKSTCVVGVRVVDKTKARKPLYRVEVWLSTQETDARSEVLENLYKEIEENGVCSRETLPKVWKNHPTGQT